MIIFKEYTKLDYTYTDCVLLAHAILGKSLTEGSDDSANEIVQQINALDFDTDPVQFHKSLHYAVQQKHGEYLAPRSLASIKKMKTYKVKGYNAGFALTKMAGTLGFSEIVAVHNASPFSHIGIYLMGAAKRSGGKYLECFGEHLSRVLYATVGFEVYKTLEKVTMPDGRMENLYFMKLKNAALPST